MALNANVLIVDDEKNIREGLKRALANSYNIFLAEDGNEALKTLKENNIDIVITDLKMPNIDGNSLMKIIVKDDPSIPVIILTGHGTIENAVSSIHEGAYDFITKPFDLEHLNLILERALTQRELVIKNRYLQSQIKRLGDIRVIGQSEKITKIYNIVKQVASTKASVLILGENGVGKELVANMIHESSDRLGKPFIKVHCASLPESLLESELFGHEKGAFTGAIKTRKGRFELANGGTIFLDEIGEISQYVQIKLLRVLQEKVFERVGGEESIKVDVRIIAATNRNLKQGVDAENFRKDLYYRLNVVQIDVPPLRERKEDIPIFISEFLLHYSKENNKKIVGITPRAKQTLYDYEWPGNIRELKNVLESAVILSKDQNIDLEDLPPHIIKSADADYLLKIELPATMKEIEKKAIMETLKFTNGNRTKASEILGITRKTLGTKITEHGIINFTDNEWLI